MKITTKGRYGLRIMLELALREGEGPVLVETVAKNQNISGKYIHVLVTALKNAGLLRAVRGPNGGLELARNAKEIDALEIVETLEGKIAWMECMDEACACPKGESCAARDLWTEVVSAVKTVLSGRTLADLAEAQRAKEAQPMMFYI